MAVAWAMAALPQTGLVGEHAARHAVTDGQPHRGPGKAALCRGQRLADDQHENFGHAVDVDHNDDQSRDDIKDGHERHQFAGYGADALDAADEHDANQHEQDAGREPGRNAELGQRAGNGVGLGHVADAEARQTAEDGEQGAQPQPVFAQADAN